MTSEIGTRRPAATRTKTALLAMCILLVPMFVGLSGFRYGSAQELPLGAPPAPVYAGSSAELAADTVDLPAVPVSVNPADRAAAAAFYFSDYVVPQGVNSGWKGSQASCTPGTTSADFQRAVLKRINYFRAMSGVPALAGFSNTFSKKSQAAALIMSVYGDNTHQPPSTVKCYTADGDAGAENSNLAFSYFGWDAISAYIKDLGDTNGPVGHRRWILYPQTQVMGTGDVAASGNYRPANALWVFDSRIEAARPPVRDEFVAWPPKGYVPYQVVYPRWSISYPNADFSSATVRVTLDGQAQTITKESLYVGFGENTLVWRMNGMSDTAAWPRPSTDTTYKVTVSNVRVGGTTKTFSYDVIVFNPNSAAPTPTPIATGTGDTGAYCPSAEEQSVLNAVNALRAAAGQPPVSLDGRLGAATRTHAADMAKAGKLSLNLTDGTTARANAQNHKYEYFLTGITVYSNSASTTAGISSYIAQNPAGVIAPDVEAVGIAQVPGPLVNGVRKYYWTIYPGAYLSYSARCSAEPTPTATSVPVVPVAGVSPARVTVNSWVSFQISNFPPNATVSITWKRVSGGTINVGSTTTDSAGHAAGTFRAPATPGGKSQLITFTSGAVSKSASIEVIARIKITPDPASRGQSVAVSLRGYAAREVISIRWKRGSGYVQVGTATASGTGSANITVTVPSWATDGDHVVRGDGTSLRAQTNSVTVSGPSSAEDIPTPTATPSPTPESTPEPSATPSPEPTAAPTDVPAETPLPEPTLEPTATPSPETTPEPTVPVVVTQEPTLGPTTPPVEPTVEPTLAA